MNQVMIENMTTDELVRLGSIYDVQALIELGKRVCKQDHHIVTLPVSVETHCSCGLRELVEISVDDFID